jgi:hypothetical protein
MSFSVSQEIPRLFWKKNVHYRDQKSTVPDPKLTRMDPVNTSTNYCLRIHLNTYYPPIYTLVSQVVSSLQVFGPKFFMHFSSPQCVLDTHTHPILLIEFYALL